MTVHYHCADISGGRLLELAGANLLVSYAYPSKVKQAHYIAQTVMLDNGAFTTWRPTK